METSNKWQGMLTSSMEWLTRLAYINILWIAFTLAGLILFGFGPSTNAMFAVMRKWLVLGETDIPVFKTFWNVYRSEFFRSNLLISVVLILGVFLYLDLTFFRSVEGVFFQLCVFLVWGLGLAYAVMLLFLFPVFVHFDLSVLKSVWYAFMVGVSHPFHAVFIVLGIIIEYIFIALLPGLAFFFSASFACLTVMWITGLIFSKIGQRREQFSEG